MPVIVGVALGGALGSSARYGLDRLIERRSAAVFPLSTFTVNVTGCFLIGLVVGYTTFSTFAQEALDLNDIHRAGVAVAYVVASVGGGVAAVYAGSALGRAI
jgi:CrcB protein